MINFILMTFAAIAGSVGYRASASFSPFTDTYTSGTGVTITAPSGATSVTITGDGGGAPGGSSNSGGSSAGGGGGQRGGRFVKTVSVTGGVTTFTHTVAASVAGVATDGVSSANGNPTTVTGGATLTANGGNHGDDAALTGNGGTGGGTATGGDTNTTGTSGSNHVGNTGGAGGGGAAAGVNGVNPGDGGGGGTKPLTSGGGARGNLAYAWS